MSNRVGLSGLIVAQGARVQEAKPHAVKKEDAGPWGFSFFYGRPATTVIPRKFALMSS